MFSARQPAPEGGLPSPSFPTLCRKARAYQALVDQVKGNEIIRGKLLSDDGRLARRHPCRSSPPPSTAANSSAVVNDIRQTVDEDLQGTGLTAELTGVPVMQLEIRHALERDRILYNAVGFRARLRDRGAFLPPPVADARRRRPAAPGDRVRARARSDGSDFASTCSST